MEHLLLLLFRSTSDGLEEEKQQANRARSVAEDNVRQLIAANDQLTGEVKKLKEDKQSLQHQVSRLSEETTTKGTELYYKQRAIDTLRHESDERQRAMEQMRAEKGELQQRIDEMEQLLRNAEAASEAAERRLTDSKQVLNIPAPDVQLSDKELGSGSFGAALCSQLNYASVCLSSCSTSLSVCYMSSTLLFSLNFYFIVLSLYLTSWVCIIWFVSLDHLFFHLLYCVHYFCSSVSWHLFIC